MVRIGVAAVWLEHECSEICSGMLIARVDLERNQSRTYLKMVIFNMHGGI
jgi:hypothetical protein